MAFSQAGIDISAQRDGNELLISWTGTLPADSVFQLYIDDALVWSGTARFTHVPYPPKQVSISVGTCGTEEAGTDFSSALPPLDDNVATLNWEGGTYLADDIVGFHVYGSSLAGGAIDFGKVLADIPAYPGNLYTDGYGLGGYGHGGYGRSASDYVWDSPELGSGVWQYAVAAYDEAGNESAPVTTSITITAPPKPPAKNSQGIRLTYTYDKPTAKVTLNWLASPN